MEEQIENLELLNPDKEWVLVQLRKLLDEWNTWKSEVAQIKDHPYDRNVASEVLADGRQNMQRHQVLQGKTLTFLNNNIKGHGFIKGFDGHSCDRTDLRLKIRVEHRIHELELLLEAVEYASGPHRHSSEPKNFDDLHPKVREITSNLVRDSHYRQAIIDAFIGLDGYVKEKSGLSENGAPLMQRAFSQNKPVLKVSENSEEQAGFMMLFAGAMKAVRNQYAHSLVNPKDKNEALEWLGFASALYRLTDKASVGD